MPDNSNSSAELHDAIDNYRYSVDSYRQFLSVVDPILADLPARDRSHMETTTVGILSEFMRNAEKEELTELKNVASWFIERAKDIDDKGEEAADGQEGAGGTEPPHEEADEEPQSKERGRRMDVSPRVGRAIIQVFKAMRGHANAERHKDILHRGVLTGLVGQFEVLISDLAHHFYRRAPGALGNQDKVLTPAELLSFQSIEEAIEFIISDKVDDLLRGSAEDWRRFFETRLKIDLQSISPEWNRFVEHIQRRHLIVHAGGRLSRRYMRNVEPALLKEYFGDNPQVGETIKLSRPYIANALDSFESTGLVLGFTSWVKLHNDHGNRQSDLLDEIIYERMLAGRWAVVLHLAAWGADQTHFDAGGRLTFKANKWLALKRLSRWNECKTEVKDFDCSALRPVFAIARAALIGDADAFFALIDRDKGECLDDRAWREWPIFDEMRQDSRFGEYLARYNAPDAVGLEAEPSSIARALLPENTDAHKPDEPNGGAT